jgi:hypothetical protein
MIREAYYFTIAMITIVVAVDLLAIYIYFRHKP